jgi:hypothetical protein
MNIFHKTVLYLLPIAYKLGRQRLETSHEPQDPASLRLLFDRIKQWCIINQFLTPANVTGGYVPNIAGKSLDNNIRNFIYGMNFKRLCVRSYLDDALALFEDTEFDKTTSRLYDLHLRLLTEIDSRTLNLYINNLTYGLTTLYSLEEDDVIPWEELFRTYPYLWILFPIQQIMRDVTPIDG